MKLKVVFMSRRLLTFAVVLSWGLAPSQKVAAQITDALVYLTDVPDYQWNWGCFGTASGNLAGYWDRHGMTNFYSGPVGGGLAPLDSFGGNSAIQSLWASSGHLADYWTGYENTGPDPYVTFGRTEHPRDCIGDFIGLSQNKWSQASLSGECRGNIDAYSFVFWDKAGARRYNHYTTNAGVYIPDIQSGFKEWARYRGYDADVFTQLADFNPERTSSPSGFTYEDVKAEINAGYPVLCFLQPNGQLSRNLNGAQNVNPEIHGVMIYGYYSDSFNNIPKGVIIRTSWGTGMNTENSWTGASWLGLFPVRGVIGFHPKPKVTRFTRKGDNITLNWDGPTAQVYNEITGQTTSPHRYCIQRATSFKPANWTPVAGPTTSLSISFTDSIPSNCFYRVVQIGQGNCP